MRTIKHRVKQLVRVFASEEGQGLVEYGLILVFVVLAVAVILKGFGIDVLHLFTNTTLINSLK